MNKGFHINITFSFNNLILDQIKLETKELDYLGNNTPYWNFSGSHSRNLAQIISPKGDDINNSIVGCAMHKNNFYWVATPLLSPLPNKV